MCYVTHSNESKRFGSVLRFGGIAGILFLYGCLDEWSQKFARGRTPDVWDLLADACGIAAAIVCYVIAKRILDGRRRQSLAVSNQTR
ncbi:hypothetical protein CGZ80_19410 [Rhodopirellula sp. MGV]|nr:hypothetical protein CGZ80_19410 [Rhodopirellula sp. MGV]PNY35995.1 VanZ family protein [Rhodopirellula baltica]